MIVAGCDAGSLTTKAVIMKDRLIMSYHLVETGFKPDLAAKNAMGGALSKAKLGFDDIDYCISTGDGRKNVSFADKNASPLLCLSKGAFWFIPSARTVVDVGGHASRVISVGKGGRVLDYGLNDKCAAGSGRFFEVLAEALELKLDDIGPLSQQSKSSVKITSQCAVFAESEVIAFLNEGKDIIDIIAGVNSSIASRIAGLIRRVGVREDVVMVGGVAKNVGVVKSLEGYLGVSVKTVPTDPQSVGAVGASLLAKEKLEQI